MRTTVRSSSLVSGPARIASTRSAAAARRRRRPGSPGVAGVASRTRSRENRSRESSRARAARFAAWTAPANLRHPRKTTPSRRGLRRDAAARSPAAGPSGAPRGRLPRAVRRRAEARARGHSRSGPLHLRRDDALLGAPPRGGSAVGRTDDPHVQAPLEGLGGDDARLGAAARHPAEGRELAGRPPLGAVERDPRGAEASGSQPSSPLRPRPERRGPGPGGADRDARLRPRGGRLLELRRQSHVRDARAGAGTRRGGRPVVPFRSGRRGDSIRRRAPPPGGAPRRGRAARAGGRHRRAPVARREGGDRRPAGAAEPRPPR